MTDASHPQIQLRIEHDPASGLFHGEIVNLRDVITFQGKTAAELKKGLAESIDAYLAFCAERGEKPAKLHDMQQAWQDGLASGDAGELDFAELKADARRRLAGI